MTLKNKGSATDSGLTEFDPVESYALTEFDGAEPLPELPPNLADISAKNIEANFFIVNMAGKARVMRWGKSSLNNAARVPEFMTFPDCANLLRNKFVKVKSKAKNKSGKTIVSEDRIPLFKYWSEHESRYTYDGVVCDAKLPKFDPALEQDSINLWRGFAVQENSEAEWFRMERHIRDILAAGDKDAAEFIFNWAAYAVQNPTDPCGVALHFYSEGRGTGKGTFGFAMKEIFGPLHGLYVTQASQVVGKFNAHLAQTGLLFLDEALFPGYREHQNTLKTLITEQNLMIEKKGVDSFPMRNALKIITASNEKWIVSASGDERRHAMFEVSDAKKQNRKYFGALKRQLYEKGGLGRMLYELRRRDIRGWHPESHIPKTALLLDNKRVSADPLMKWFADLLNEGTLPRAKDYALRNLTSHKAQSSVLYDHARKRPGLERKSDYDFAEFLAHWGTKHRESIGSVWRFPPLSEVRAAWLQKYPYWGPFDHAITEWIGDADGIDYSNDDDAG